MLEVREQGQNKKDVGQDFKENECRTLIPGEEALPPQPPGEHRPGAALTTPAPGAGPSEGALVPPAQGLQPQGPRDKDSHAHSSIVFKSLESETTQMATTEWGGWLLGHCPEHDMGMHTRE